MNKGKQIQKSFKTVSTSTEKIVNSQHKSHNNNLHSVRPCLYEAFAVYMETKHTEDYH